MSDIDRVRANAESETVTTGSPATTGLGSRAAAVGDEVLVSTPGMWKRAWRRLLRNPVGMVALTWIVLMVLLAFIGPTIAPKDPAEQFLRDRFAGPSGEYLLGTDDLGRDVFSRILVGTRVTVRSGFQTAAMAMAAAVPLGLLAGYLGGKFDLVLLRVMDAINSFPALILALSIAAVLGPGINNAMIAITIVIIPGFTRIIRGQTLALREEPYIEASRSIGTKSGTIVRKRVLPGVLSPLIVAGSILIGGAMLAEAGLSFLGLGAQPPAPSWGNMLQRGFGYINTEPLLMFFPGLMITLTILSFNMFGDALRDSLSLIDIKPPKGMKRGRLGITSAEPVRDLDPARPAPDPATAILSVRNLSVAFNTPAGSLTVVTDVSFDVAPGEVLGLVGESGCGKSVTSSAIMRLIQSPPGRITKGEVYFDGVDLLGKSLEEMRKLRGTEISMVFQDPMSALNPAFTIGNQMTEVIRRHQGFNKAQAEERAAELLSLVGIPDARARLAEYPHRFSGGMRQRVLIAMALSNNPRLVIADEPTTALDVTVQAQILDLLKKLQTELGMAMIFVTHDLGVVADICDRVAVMYAGEIVEQGKVHDLFANPRHPYTRALLGAIPQLAEAGERLTSIPGTVPPPPLWPTGCRFSTRCDFVTPACTEAPVELENVGGQFVRCIRHDELAMVQEGAVR
ncbi:MAG: dipeptide/oligopeptide/nickel ABC transporter permease/ATP-binding protein [Acidimicrobiia bacterium]